MFSELTTFRLVFEGNFNVSKSVAFKLLFIIQVTKNYEFIPHKENKIYLTIFLELATFDN